MAWGPPAGSPMASGSAVAQSAAAGLPFAGVPHELEEKVGAILDAEPEHPDPGITFSQRVTDHRPLTLRTFLAPHRWAMFGAFALVVLETITVQLGPLLTQIGIDQGVVAKDTQVLVAVTAFYVASIVISTVTGTLRIRFTGRLGERLMYELRVRVFSHLQRLSLDFYTDEKAGRLMSRMTSDIESLSQLFQEGLVNLAVQALTLIVVTVILFWLNATLAALTLAVVVPVMLLMTLWFRAASDRGYTLVRDRIADVLADLQESLSGIRILVAHNRRRHNVASHGNIVGEYRDANLYTAKVGAVYGPATETIGVLAQAIILAIGGTMVLRGSLTVGELTAFLLYVTAFFAPIQQLVQLYNTYQQGQAAVTKLRGLLGTEPGVLEAEGAVELPPVEGAVQLRDVHFAYGEGPVVLHGIDLAIAPGETVSLVGSTGAGKSTVAKLVTRFYDPTAGAVLLDGHDLREVTIESLRRQIGVVPQEPFLFNGTIRDNIAFARPDASDDEVWETCRTVGIDDLVERLPAGLDTPVHERGVSLASGERQLLALARAFFARPRVLVLDEATSNLDLMSESRIERALDVVLEGRTAIIIAHRLATARRADRIVVIEGGEVIEQGPHDELVQREGAYAAMHATWERHLDAS
jgi:ATP-binding cassette, subfamily B, bacterial